MIRLKKLFHILINLFSKRIQMCFFVSLQSQNTFNYGLEKYKLDQHITMISKCFLHLYLFLRFFVVLFFFYVNNKTLNAESGKNGCTSFHKPSIINMRNSSYWVNHITVVVTPWKFVENGNKKEFLFCFLICKDKLSLYVLKY